METALRKRIAPSAPLTLNLEADGGSKFTRNFRLCLDINAIAEIENRTSLSLLRGTIWKHLNADTLRVMLWASVLAHHPEFRTKNEQGEPTDEGLEVIGSYIDPSNTAEVTEGMWRAYLATLRSDKRQELIEMRADLERREGKQVSDDGVPLASAPAPTSAPASDGSSSGQSPATISDSPKANSAP